MMRIEDFITRITFTRKRNGIILLDEENAGILSTMKSMGINFHDFAQQVNQRIIISDDALLDLIYQSSLGKSSVFLNPEVHLAPRFTEDHYLKSLLPKLMNSEPIHPIFLAFYSRPLYQRFKSYYKKNVATADHWFETES